jgi:nucleoside-diphosphate-sugar epimerase
MSDKTVSIGVLGGNGFLGKSLVQYFLDRGFIVTAITKENYHDHKKEKFDVLINANGNSKRFWANQNPEGDYELSVVSVKDSMVDFHYEQYIYISSSDVYPDHDDSGKAHELVEIDAARLEPYGLHKFQAEQLVKGLHSYLILRCSALVGPGIRKGVVKDIMDNSELFVSKDSYLQFVAATEVARCIEELLSRKANNEIFNLGGKGSLTVGKVCEMFGKPCHFRPDAKLQQYEMDVTKLDKIVGLETSAHWLQILATEESEK